MIDIYNVSSIIYKEQSGKYVMIAESLLSKKLLLLSIFKYGESHER